jgi:hypothetical protein
MRDRYLASQQPPAEAAPGVWVRHPTVGDLVEIDDRQSKPGFIGWYLMRFMVTSEGSPIFAPDEQEKADRVHAAIATKVLEKVGQLMQSPPDLGEAGDARPRLEVRPDPDRSSRPSRHGLDRLDRVAS